MLRLRCARPATAGLSPRDRSTRSFYQPFMRQSVTDHRRAFPRMNRASVTRGSMSIRFESERPRLGSDQRLFLAAFSARFSIMVLAGFFLVFFFRSIPLDRKSVV